MNRRSMMRVLGGVYVVSATITLCGCGGEDWRAETYPTTGRLVINNRPAAGALVHFNALGQPVDRRRSTPWAKVQDDGSFRVSTYASQDGAPAGDYAVTIVWPQDASKPSTFDQLSRQYADPGSSQWRVTITEGENILDAYALEGVRLARPDARAAGPPM